MKLRVNVGLAIVLATVVMAGAWSVPRPEAPAPAQATRTYANLKAVWVDDFDTVTIISPDLTDTQTVSFAPAPTWTSTLQAFGVIPLSATEFMGVSLDTFSAPAVLDSAVVDSICGANGISGCPEFVMGYDPGRDIVASAGAVPAFPGAEGHAALALQQCRDSVYLGGDGIAQNGDEWPLKPWNVTSLNTYWGTDGSLAAHTRDSVESKQYDVIVFHGAGGRTNGVGGMSAAPGVDNDCVYVAGQTAPGGYGAWTNRSYSTGPIRIGRRDATVVPTDIVYRYFHVWKDTCEGGDCAPQTQPLDLNHSEDVIVDHMSLYGGWDQTIAIYAGRGSSHDRVTLSRNMIIATWDRTTACMAMTNVAEVQGSSVNNLDFHNNYWSTRHRHCRIYNASDSLYPSLDSVSWQEINNTFYGWQSGIIDMGGLGKLSFERNYLKESDVTTVNNVVRIGSGGYIEADPDSADWEIYFRGSYYEVRNPDTTAAGDQAMWDNFVRVGTSPIGADSVGHVASSPPAPVTHDFPVTQKPATSLFAEHVVAGRVGVDSILNDDGVWVAHRTNWDSLYLQQAIDGTFVESTDPGQPDDPLQMDDHPLGDWPSLATQTRTDTDGDGCPDTYESLATGGASTTSYNCLDPVPTASGYLRLEHYVNGTHPDCPYNSVVVLKNARYDGSAVTGSNCPVG